MQEEMGRLQGRDKHRETSKEREKAKRKGGGAPRSGGPTARRCPTPSPSRVYLLPNSVQVTCLLAEDRTCAVTPTAGPLHSSPPPPCPPTAWNALPSGLALFLITCISHTYSRMLPKIALALPSHTHCCILQSTRHHLTLSYLLVYFLCSVSLVCIWA